MHRDDDGGWETLIAKKRVVAARNVMVFARASTLFSTNFRDGLQGIALGECDDMDCVPVIASLESPIFVFLGFHDRDVDFMGEMPALQNGEGLVVG